MEWFCCCSNIAFFRFKPRLQRLRKNDTWTWKYYSNWQSTPSANEWWDGLCGALLSTSNGTKCSTFWPFCKAWEQLWSRRIFSGAKIHLHSLEGWERCIRTQKHWMSLGESRRVWPEGWDSSKWRCTMLHPGHLVINFSVCALAAPRDAHQHGARDAHRLLIDGDQRHQLISSTAPQNGRRQTADLTQKTHPPPSQNII